jgi:hypothetical protein
LSAPGSTAKEGTGVRRISDMGVGRGRVPTRGWLEVPKWVFESWYLFYFTSELRQGEKRGRKRREERTEKERERRGERNGRGNEKGLINFNPDICLYGTRVRKLN